MPNAVIPTELTSSVLATVSLKDGAYSFVPTVFDSYPARVHKATNHKSEYISYRIPGVVVDASGATVLADGAHRWYTVTTVKRGDVRVASYIVDGVSHAAQAASWYTGKDPLKAGDVSSIYHDFVVNKLLAALAPAQDKESVDVDYAQYGLLADGGVPSSYDKIATYEKEAYVGFSWCLGFDDLYSPLEYAKRRFVATVDGKEVPVTSATLRNQNVVWSVKEIGNRTKLTDMDMFMFPIYMSILVSGNREAPTRDLDTTVAAMRALCWYYLSVPAPDTEVALDKVPSYFKGCKHYTVGPDQCILSLR